MSVEVANESGLAVDEVALVTVARYVLDELGVNPLAELSVLLVDAESMAALHGDVVLCPDVARRQAAHAGHSLADELHMLCVHGVLHLLGYDHGGPDEEREMFGLQGRLLEAWRTASRGGQPRSR